MKADKEIPKKNLNLIHKLVIQNPGLRNLLPSYLKDFVKGKIFSSDYEKAVWAQQNPYLNTDYEWGTDKFKSDVKIGIVYDPAQYHKYYISACLDMKINYKVVNILSDDWQQQIADSGCDAFVVWPHLNNPHIKEAFDERIYLLENSHNKIAFPGFYDIYLLDNKRRVRDWLIANNFTPPKTWCFFEEREAFDFLATANYPLVSKTVKGSVSRGVKILRSKKEALALLKLVFSKGIVPFRMDPRMVQWDTIIFQEYLHEVKEKRMLRIGNSYLAIEKVRKGDFHSGSGTMNWADPGDELLSLTKQITDAGNFESMNVDFFISRDGRILVNELHALFHGPQIEDSSLTGRYKQDDNNNWHFEQGNFYRNYCCNLRLAQVLEKIGVSSNEEWWVLPNFGLNSGMDS